MNFQLNHLWTCQEFESFDEKMAKLLKHSLSEHATKPNEYLMQTEMYGKIKIKITLKQQSFTPGTATFSFFFFKFFNFFFFFVS